MLDIVGFGAVYEGELVVEAEVGVEVLHHFIGEL